LAIAAQLVVITLAIFTFLMLDRHGRISTAESARNRA
jgi:hypothetical protein